VRWNLSVVLVDISCIANGAAHLLMHSFCTCTSENDLFSQFAHILIEDWRCGSSGSVLCKHKDLSPNPSPNKKNFSFSVLVWFLFFVLYIFWTLTSCPINGLQGFLPFCRPCIQNLVIVYFDIQKLFNLL
jgi:hypothetical protein